MGRKSPSAPLPALSGGKTEWKQTDPGPAKYDRSQAFATRTILGMTHYDFAGVLQVETKPSFLQAGLDEEVSTWYRMSNRKRVRVSAPQPQTKESVRVLLLLCHLNHVCLSMSTYHLHRCTVETYWAPGCPTPLRPCPCPPSKAPETRDVCDRWSPATGNWVNRTLKLLIPVPLTYRLAQNSERRQWPMMRPVTETPVAAPRRLVTAHRSNAIVRDRWRLDLCLRLRSGLAIASSSDSLNSCLCPCLRARTLHRCRSVRSP